MKSPIDPEMAEVLRAGTYWLYQQAQPKDAAVSHHGVQMDTEHRRVSFVPRGHHRAPVIVVNVKNQRWTRGSWAGESELENPLAAGEITALYDWVRDVLGLPVTGTWGGQYESGSIGLARPAHPTLLDALARYRAGCPRTDEGHRHGDVFCRCGWYLPMYEKLIKPS